MERTERLKQQERLIAALDKLVAAQDRYIAILEERLLASSMRDG